MMDTGNINEYFNINNGMMRYKYYDLVSASGVIKYQIFPLTINLNDKFDFIGNDYLKNLLLCDSVRNYSKGVYVDFSNMECSLIKDILDKLDDLYLNGDLENISFRFKYNKYLNDSSETYGIVECDYNTIKETVFVIDMIIKYVKHFNLSEFEKIMFVYDLLKERTYEEHIYSKIGIDNTRDKVLSSVLFDEAIVCLGYTNIMTAVLRGLDIDAEICNVMSKNSNDGHSVVVVNIKDLKYGCEGRKLFFDITKDNKQIDYGWENKYDGFALCSCETEYLENILGLDCDNLKKCVDGYQLDDVIKKELIANTRYILHSIDAYKYDAMYAGERSDFSNDNYLDYVKELDAEFLSNVRKILSMKMAGKDIDEEIELIREFLDDNPEYIDLLDDSLGKLNGNYFDLVDYTKNPMIPDNIRNSKR